MKISIGRHSGDGESELGRRNRRGTISDQRKRKGSSQLSIRNNDGSEKYIRREKDHEGNSHISTGSIKSFTTDGKYSKLNNVAFRVVVGFIIISSLWQLVF